MLEKIISELGLKKSAVLPDPEHALPGRLESMTIPLRHHVNGHSLSPPYPGGMETALFGMGCFWGAERRFWQTRGVYVTAVGYAGGYTPNPTYDEVCSGLTGHAEVVLVVYDPTIVAYQRLLRLFWESHDPTQGMRQGNDFGTQYRSFLGVYTDEQLRQARASLQAYQQHLAQSGFGPITSQISDKPPRFYFAEPYHQQYLAKNPDGYCGLQGTGVQCPLQGEG